METNSFSIQERNKLITSIFQQRKIVEQLNFDIENAHADEQIQNHLIQEHEKASNELSALEEIYIANLSQLPISRCPYTDEQFYFSIDLFGLDGPWWNAEQPIRTAEETIPSFFAITGSVNIIGDPPLLPFTIKPGPAVPWVCPRLLSNENISAVLSHLKIGLYDAYITVYFTNNLEVNLKRINTWGTNEYLINDSDGLAVLDRTYDEEEDYDFNIAPWIKKGKLHWIAINDKTLELQNSVDNCPYLDIKGYKYPVIIQNKTIKNSMITLEFEDDEAEVDKSTNFCSQCGNKLNEGARFCSNCGCKIE
jgi:hypothetical protein